jgi:hypothetical protein
MGPTKFENNKLLKALILVTLLAASTVNLFLLFVLLSQIIKDGAKFVKTPISSCDVPFFTENITFVKN